MDRNCLVRAPPGTALTGITGLIVPGGTQIEGDCGLARLHSLGIFPKVSALQTQPKIYGSRRAS